jgi:polyisoprenoid-binding protein YceI
MKTRLFKSFLIAVSMLAAVNLQAQVLKVIPKSSYITILGTSNLHDWSSKSEQIRGELVLAGEKQVKALNLDVAVKSIKSNEKIMDTKTYETFNAEKNPNISFRLTEVSNLQITGSDVNVIFSGNLTMAGTTRKVTIKSAGKLIKSGTYKFTGIIPIKMSDYKMSAPTALLGALKVGDAVKLDFNILLEEQVQASN